MDAYHTLTGHVQLDPQVLAAKGGAILSNNGSSIAVAIGGAVIANNGSNLISDAGGTLIAGNTGNFIASDAGSGGTAASSPGGALLAAGGLLSDHGAALTGSGSALTSKTKYTLQQVQERPPTAGMLVSAVSLKTHKYVPVGVDPDGKPVYAIYSNLQGGYELYLPKAEEGNVLVVASAPAVHDDSLVCNAFTPVEAAQQVALDEDTALATAHIRRLFVARLASLLTGNFGDDLLANLGKRNAFLAPILERLTRVTKGIAAAGHVPQGPGWGDSPQVRDLAQLMTDAGLAYVDTSTMHTSKLYTPDWNGPDEPVYPALGDVFRLVRASSERYIAAHPADHPPRVTFLQDRRNGKEADQPACAYRVELPLENASTMGTYIQTRVLVADVSHPLANTTNALRALSLVQVPVDKPYSPDDAASFGLPSGARVLLSERIDACQIAIMSAILLTLSPPDWNGEAPYPPATQAIVDLANAYTASHSFDPAPQGTPRPDCLP
jgi:hypothetical protein